MRSKKALYNIVTQLICDAVTIISGLILPRLILSTYGSEYNGIISSITQFLEYISILTLGVSGSTRVAIYKAKGDVVKISKVLKDTQKFMKKIAAFFIIYVIVLTFLYPIIINSEINNIEVSLLVLVIGIGIFFEYLYGITYYAFTSAMQCRYISNTVLIILRILNTIISAFLIVNGKTIIFVKLIGGIFFALGPIIISLIINKKFNIIKNIESDNTTLSQRKDVMAHSIANSVHQYTDIFLLSIFSTAKIVSVYSVYVLVLNGVKKIELLFTNGLEGAFGEMWAKGEKETFSKNFNTFEYLIFSLISVIFTCCFFLLIPFVKLYTKNVNDINYIIPSFAYISILSYIAYCLRTPYVVCVQSAGKYKETKNGAIMEAIINFVLSAILIFPLGIVGITIGTLVANVFRTIQYEVYASKFLLNRSNKVFVKRILWLIGCFCVMILFISILPKIEITSWKNWILSGMFYFLISSIFTIVMSIIFYKKELLNSVDILKQMFRRKKGISL